MKLPPFSGPAHELLPGAEGWPAGLDRLAAPPPRLRVLGRPPPWPRPVAMVGTRFADDEALNFARSLAAELVAAGCSILSGGAHGVDGAAHEGALQAGGVTVAVLAHGFDLSYPRKHTPLFRRMLAQGGALATERPDGSHLRHSSFIQRNRLIAAMAEAVVVVQAPARSGALSTAAAALSLGIPVFSVPMAPWIVRGEGNVRLLREGAGICTCARDVLSVRPSGGAYDSAPALAPTPPRRGKPKVSARLVDGMDDDCRAVYGQLGSRARHPDELAERLSMPLPRLQRALLELVLSGVVRERGDGAYRAT